MRRHDIVISGLALLALVSLSACSPGVRPSSAASNEDTGQISAVQAPQNLPSTYTTQDGDTLMRVAARPEIYNDPDLWPLLKDANAESLVDKAADSPLDADITLAAFGNTRSYGGGLLVCPNADYTDGLLDITMAHSGSRTKLIRLFPTVLKGTHVERDEVTTARATTVHVECPGINVYADGDFACPLPAELSAVRGALQILRAV